MVDLDLELLDVDLDEMFRNINDHQEAVALIRIYEGILKIRIHEGILKIRIYEGILKIRIYEGILKSKNNRMSNIVSNRGLLLKHFKEEELFLDKIEPIACLFQDATV